MALKLRPSRDSSSRPVTSTRRSSLSGAAAIVSVRRVKRAIGASAVRATRIPRNAASAIPPAPMPISNSSWLCRVRSTSVIGRATISAPLGPIPVTITRMWVLDTVMSVK